MIMMMDMPAVVMEETGAPGWAEIEAMTMVNFYLPKTRAELANELENYHLEQQELARLQREKEEAEAKAKEEAEKERLKKEAEEKARLAALKPNFNPYDVTKPSHVSSEQFYQILSNTGMVDVAWVFPYAEKTYGISSIFLAGLVALESGWGTSDRAVYHNNMTGYNIKSDSDIHTFETRADSILATAKLLATHYIPQDGKYHRGVSIWNINESYCASNDWADKIHAIANKLLQSL